MPPPWGSVVTFVHICPPPTTEVSSSYQKSRGMENGQNVLRPVAVSWTVMRIAAGRLDAEAKVAKDTALPACTRTSAQATNKPNPCRTSVSWRQRNRNVEATKFLDDHIELTVQQMSLEGWGIDNYLRDLFEIPADKKLDDSMVLVRDVQKALSHFFAPNYFD